MKSLFNDVAVTRDEIVDTPETTSIHPKNKANYWLIAVILLEIACLLLLVVIIVKFCMKHGLTIPCFLFYWYRYD